MTRLSLNHHLGILRMVILFFLVPGCAQQPARLVVPAERGALQGSLSVQVTAAENKKLVVFDSADLAEMLRGPIKGDLRKRGFQVAGEEAQEHLIVHVAQAARGTGSVNSLCTLQVYLYDFWPGTLEPKRNQGQELDGSLPGRAPRLHFTLELKDQRRLRVDSDSELRMGGEYFAERLAEELAKIRASTPPKITPVEVPVASPAAPPASTPAPAPRTDKDEKPFQIIHRLERAPGNLTLTPSGELFVSLHQFFEPEFPVARVTKEGELQQVAAEAQLDSVLGIQSDENGVVWMLDNGMKSTQSPRLVGWHSVRDKIVADIDLSQAGASNSFFNDLVIDLDHEHAYLAEPAGGTNAAIVVVDLEKGTARRVLEGHASVVFEDVDLLVDGQPLEVERPDGSTAKPRVSINPIAADVDNIWLYFGPMHGTSLYRIETAYLRDASLAEERLEQKVERVADKPICDGISMDRAGNVYLGDLSRDAVWKISPDGSHEIVARDPLLSWVDAFSFGPDGDLYAVANQLHKSAPLNGGEDRTKPPFLILKLSTDAAGVIGR